MITEIAVYKITYIAFVLNLISILCFSYLEDTLWISNSFFVLFCAISSTYLFLFKRQFKLGILHFYYFILLFWMLLTCIWSLDIEIALQRFWTIFQIAIFNLLTYEFFKDKGLIACEDILKAIFYAGVSMGLYSILVYTPVGFVTAIITGNRLGTEINQINIYGMNAAITVIIGIYLYLRNNSRIYFFGSAVGLLCVFSSGSRKALLIIGFGVLILYVVAYGWKSTYKMIIPIITSFLIYAFANNYIEGTNIFDRFETFINIFTVEGDIDSSTLERIQMIEFGLKSFMERPLYGYGLNNFSVLYGNYVGWATYSHNNYVEILVSLGIVGFVLYYWIFAWLLLKFKKIIRLKSCFYKEIKLLYGTIGALLIIRLFLDFAEVSYFEKLIGVYLVLFIICMRRASNQYLKILGENNSETRVCQAKLSE